MPSMPFIPSPPWLREKVAEVIDRWKPAVFRREIDYRHDLAQFLATELPGTTVTAPFKSKVGEVDIGIEKKTAFGEGLVLVELKYNLSDHNKADNLIGQIRRYRKLSKYLFVVLCGETNMTLCTRIEDELQVMEDAPSWMLELGLEKADRRLFVKRHPVGGA